MHSRLFSDFTTSSRRIVGGILLLSSLGGVSSALAQVTFTRITKGAIAESVGLFYNCAWGDYDADGYVDLVVTTAPGSSRLFHNEGHGDFSSVPDSVIEKDSPSTGAIPLWADYDNDGDLDLFVTWMGGFGDMARLFPEAYTGVEGLLHDRLYRNEGNGTFLRVTEGDWVNDTGDAWGSSSAWADFDNDGYLDLYVGNAHEQQNFLYRNNGDGTMIEVGNGTRVVRGEVETHGVVWTDYNNDRFPDLIIMGQPTRQFRNNGDGTFTPEGLQQDQLFDWGVAAGDYDNDGDMDLAVASWHENRLYRNDGAGRYTEVMDGVINVEDSIESISPSWADYDNDGYLDLHITNHRGWADFLYHNNGDGTFTRVTDGPIVNDGGLGWGAAWADYDNDGDLDLVETDGAVWPSVSSPKKLKLYRNDGTTNNWLILSLEGVVSNRSAIGAKVRIRAKVNGVDLNQLREVTSASGSGSQNDLRVHFGLGDAEIVDTVRIEWPSGIVDESTDIVANHIFTLTEGSTTTVVDIPDEDLEAVLREALVKPEGEITVADMESLTELEITWGSENLIGLERAVNLTELVFFAYNGHPLIDISPLAGLKKLKILFLSGTMLSDISPLAGLTNLTELGLPLNWVSDVSPLADLVNLTELNLGENRINDISPLAGLRKLTRLNLGTDDWGTDHGYHNRIRDLQPLTNLTHLQVLSLENNEIMDISPLAGLTNLAHLDLRSNSISNLSPLSGMEHLLDQGPTWGGALKLDGNCIDITSGSPARQIIDNLNAREGLTVEFSFQRGVIRLPLEILQPPQSFTAAPGSTAIFTVTAGGPGGESYEWRHGDTVVGENSPTLTLTDVQDEHAGQYTVTVTAKGESVSSRSVTLGVKGPDADKGKLLNISTRGQILDGAKVLIAGFVLEGTGQKNVLVRGIGPGLDQWVDGVCADPKLELFRVGDVSTAPMAANEVWGNLAVDVPTICQRVGAFALDTGSKDAVLHLDLKPGAYTAKVTSLDGLGIGLVELYDADADPQASTCQVANISTRGEVGSAAQILIAGFIVEGDVPMQVLIRGVGPGLAAFGVDDVLENPVLTLYKDSEPDPQLVATNNNWSDNSNATDIVAAYTATGAFDLDVGSKDAAILSWLEPGSYTAQVSGIGITTGVALVEVYLVD